MNKLQRDKETELKGDVIKSWLKTLVISPRLRAYAQAPVVRLGEEDLLRLRSKNVPRVPCWVGSTLMKMYAEMMTPGQFPFRVKRKIDAIADDEDDANRAGDFDVEQGRGDGEEEQNDEEFDHDLHSQYEGQYDSDDNIDQYEGRASIDTVDNDGLLDSQIAVTPPRAGLRCLGSGEHRAQTHAEGAQGLHKAFRSKETVVFQDIARTSIRRGLSAQQTRHAFSMRCCCSRQKAVSMYVKMNTMDRFAWSKPTASTIFTPMWD